MATRPARSRFKQHSGQPAPPATAQAGWDVEDYCIDVDLDTDERLVTGIVDVTATARADDPGPLLLHASDPEITSISVNGADADWSRDGDEVTVGMPAGLSSGDTVMVRVRYTAPGNTAYGYGLNWGDPIFSFHEPYGARNWLVVYDEPGDKATLTWTVTVPSNLVVVTNGTLQETSTVGERSTWVFDFPWPIATYLMVLHAGDFAESTESGGAVPVSTWAPPDLLDAAAADFASTGEMIDLYSGLFGEYPWSHYANVVAPMSGAMEHTTATTFGQEMVGTDWAPLVNAHELSHHWWGDWVTCADWAEIWLNEGFASYAEVLWVEHDWGPEYVPTYLEWQRVSYFEWYDLEAGSALYDPLFLFGGTVYDKGSLVLHMLRTVVGDEAFFTGLRAYGEAHAHDVATTEDFRAAMEAAWGEPLDWFFDEWVYRPGNPEYVVGLTQSQRDDGTWQVDVHVAQPGDETWAMPVAVALALEDGSLVEDTIWTEGSSTVVSYCTDAPASALTFDPEGDLLYASLVQDDALFEPAEDSCSPLPETAARGCGCAAVRVPGAWGLPLLLLLAGRRRSSAREAGRES